jgi:alpha-N-acetylglucosamine transferase
LNKLEAMVDDELDAIETYVSKNIQVMVLMMNLIDSYQTLIIFLESSKVEDHKWQNMSTKLLNKELMKKKGETSQVGGK